MLLVSTKAVRLYVRTLIIVSNCLVSIVTQDVRTLMQKSGNSSRGQHWVLLQAEEAELLPVQPDYHQPSGLPQRDAHHLHKT